MDDPTRGDVRSRYTRLFRRGEGTDRMQFFSDAVFAIALTLLVLDIRLPETEAVDLLPALLALWPQYFAFALSFVIIALNWTSHHAKYRVIVRFDARLLQLNFVLLFLVAIVPFPTSVLSEYGAETPAVVVYAATVAALSVTQLVIWAYAVRAGLTTKDVDAAMFRYIVLSILPAPVVFLLSIPIAFVDPSVAMWSWFAILPVGWLFGLLSRRDGVSRRNPGTASAAGR
jgi:uncharacterized membrane protein